MIELTYLQLQNDMENKEDEIKIGNYIVRKKIGEGSFGQIFEAQHNGNVYAIKTVFNL